MDGNILSSDSVQSPLEAVVTTTDLVIFFANKFDQ